MIEEYGILVEELFKFIKIEDLPKVSAILKEMLNTIYESRIQSVAN